MSENEYLRELDEMGLQKVREMLLLRIQNDAKRNWTKIWLDKKEAEENAKSNKRKQTIEEIIKETHDLIRLLMAACCVSLVISIIALVYVIAGSFH